MNADKLEAIIIPLPCSRELRLTPTECSTSRVLVEVAVWERGALLERSEEPLLLPEALLRVVAAALTRMATKLEKANARRAEASLWAP